MAHTIKMWMTQSLIHPDQAIIGNSNVQQIQVSTSGRLVLYLNPSPFYMGDGEWLIWDDGSRTQRLLPCQSICVSVPRQNQIRIANRPPADALGHVQYTEHQQRDSGTEHARLSVCVCQQQMLESNPPSGGTCHTRILKCFHRYIKTTRNTASLDPTTESRPSSTWHLGVLSFFILTK